MKVLGADNYEQFKTTTAAQDAMFILTHEGIDEKLVKILVNKLVFTADLRYHIFYMGVKILEFDYDPVYQGPDIIGYKINYETG